MTTPTTAALLAYRDARLQYGFARSELLQALELPHPAALHDLVGHRWRVLQGLSRPACLSVAGDNPRGGWLHYRLARDAPLRRGPYVVWQAYDSHSEEGAAVAWVVVLAEAEAPALTAPSDPPSPL